MITTVVYAIVALAVIGAVAAVILFFVAQKFRVYEDPRIDTVTDKLPGANCGGCGYAGCRALAEAIVKSESMEGKFCPVGGDKTMQQIAAVMGLEAGESDPMVAVVRCNGGKCNSIRKVEYDGLKNCLYAHMNFSGEGGCADGCLGYGNCVEVCKFDALKINEQTGLPEVDS
ncbi:MAG: RnfABCDGE type electron transport complex subunit B, partial [Bacteroidales bacterium]|nr:RnfABCDGE type electron transport complex subunit B [Bacteroidales bacterium]